MLFQLLSACTIQTDCQYKQSLGTLVRCLIRPCHFVDDSAATVLYCTVLYCCYAVNRQARDAEVRRLRGELRQHESNTAESFWKRSVAATRDIKRMETERDYAQAKASRTWFAPHPGASRCGTGGLAHSVRISYVRSRRSAFGAQNHKKSTASIRCRAGMSSAGLKTRAVFLSNAADF